MRERLGGKRNFETQSLHKKTLFLFYFQNTLYNFFIRQIRSIYKKENSESREIVYQSESGKEIEITPDFNKRI